jgi:cobalamin-dependent methionine synthase I
VGFIIKDEANDKEQHNSGERLNFAGSKALARKINLT